MKSGKNLLPIVLISGGVIISLATCYHQTRREPPSAKPAIISQPATKASPVPTVQAAKPPSPRFTTNYQCDEHKAVQALYDNTDPASPKVTLTIDGQRYDLSHVPSPVGSIYITEQGVHAGQGMRWYVQGLEGRLLAMAPNHTTNPEREKVLMRCQQPI